MSARALPLRGQWQRCNMRARMMLLPMNRSLLVLSKEGPVHKHMHIHLLRFRRPILQRMWEPLSTLNLLVCDLVRSLEHYA